MFRMILIPLLLAAVFFVLGCLPLHLPGQTSGAPAGKSAAVRLLPLAAGGAQIALLLLYRLLHHFLLAGGDYLLSVPVIVLMCIVTDAAVLGWLRYRGSTVCRLCLRLGVLVLALFLAEVCLFNAKSFTAHYREVSVPSDRFVIDEEDEVSLHLNHHILLGQDTAVEVTDVPEWCRAVRLNVTQSPGHRPFFVRVLMKDDNFRDTFIIAGNKMTTGYGRALDYSLKCYGDLHALRFEFSEMDVPLQFYGIVCSNKIPFHFNSLRFIGLFCLIGSILFIRLFGLHTVVYDPARKHHAAALYVVTALCTLSALFLWLPDQKPIRYPEEFQAETANPYEQLFDAFAHGQLWLNVELDPQLAGLSEDIYDRSVRDSFDIDYAWDRSYYNGHLYSYFGAAPVLTFYYPFYWLTGCLPTQFHVNFFYSILAIPFLCLVLLELVRRYCRHVNLLMLMLMLPTAVILSGPCYFMQYPSQYNEAVAAGFCYLMLSLWLGFRALEIRRSRLRLLALAGSGLFCVLSAASRPSIVLGELILAPAFLGVLADRQTHLRSRIGQAAAYLLPVIAGAAGIMAYNNMRFSSPLDFGESYQLTVSNIQANKVYLSSLPSAMYHYFLQPTVKKTVFPFFTYSVFNLENYGMFKYYEIMLGVFNYPLLLMGCLMLPQYLTSRNSVGGTASRRQAKWLAAICLLLSILLAWVEFCKGGASIRYQMDMIHLLILLSAIVVLTLVRSPKRYIYPFTVVILAATILIKFLLMIHITTEGHTVTTLITVYPMLQEQLEDAVIFWD